MSFYLRSSVRVGPFRCSLSPSGLGVSAGIPGLRVGATPHGTYVRLGPAGVSTYAFAPIRNTRRSPTRVPGPPPGYSPGSVVLNDITGANTLHMRPAQPSELLRLLNQAHARHRLWPWLTAMIIILTIAASPLILLPGIPAVVLAAYRDRVRRTIVAFYEVDQPVHDRYQHLVTAFGPACHARQAWHAVATGAVTTPYQRKVNAGAASIVRRETLTRSLSGPPRMATNIQIPSLESPTQSIYFLPDRILIRDRTGYTELGYTAITTTTDIQRFIEDGHVSADTRVVGSTWKFVNKNGGPDRRFKNNRQLPVVLYSRVRFTSPAGLNMLLSFSDARAANPLPPAIRAMPPIPRRHPPGPTPPRAGTRAEEPDSAGSSTPDLDPRSQPPHLARRRPDPTPAAAHPSGRA